MIGKKKTPWSWIPTLYFSQGLPYVVVMTVSVILYKRLGLSNTDIALYSSWLYLPWVIKPLWSPIVDMLKTKRWWIVLMQLFIGAGLAGIAFTIPGPEPVTYTLAFFWLLAFSSATHDIAADGFYMLALDDGDQSYFVGIRSTFYRIAMIAGQGLLVVLAGFLEVQTGKPPVEVMITPDGQYQQGGIEPEHTYFILSTPTAISLEEVNSHKARNVQQGFVLKEESKKEQAEEKGYWEREVSAPLKRALQQTFGKEEREVSAKARYQEVGIRLPSMPEEEVIINFRRSKGDPGIHLIQGERIVFNPDNWQEEAKLIFEYEPSVLGSSPAIFKGTSGNIPFAWSVTFGVIAILFILFTVYHFFILPKPSVDVALPRQGGESLIQGFFSTFASFFRKENIGMAIAFMMLFRLGESQLVKLASPFLIDDPEMGGLGMSTGQLGFVYGTIGVVCLTIGGIVGGMLASKYGLKRCLLWMTLGINLPNLVYVYLSFVSVESFYVIAACVGIEQLGYGFGFTAYMLYLIYFSEGKNKTAHYAISTGFMALGMMIPGMVSGWIQDAVGYTNFFVWVMLCTIPSFWVISKLKIDPNFGIKKKE